MTINKTKPEIDLLKSNQIKEVITAAKTLRSTGSEQDIPAIIDSLSQQRLYQARVEIISLLADIKIPEAVDQLMKAYDTLSDETTLVDVTRICWESKLDFSPHLQFFTDLFTSGSYELAIECFTVIEKTVIEQRIPSKNLIHIEDQLCRDIHQMSPDKQFLAQTLIEFVASDPD